LCAKKHKLKSIGHERNKKGANDTYSTYSKKNRKTKTFLVPEFRPITREDLQLTNSSVFSFAFLTTRCLSDGVANVDV
jgi:hypothetical protein